MPKKFLANMVERAESASEADVDELRRINIRLIDATKERLVNLNRLNIVAEEREDETDD